MAGQDPFAAEVDALLAVAGLEIPRSDRDRLVAGYATLKAGLRSLYALPEARDEAPALIFKADPHLGDWRGECRAPNAPS
jgi:hypothetical protein